MAPADQRVIEATVISAIAAFCRQPWQRRDLRTPTKNVRELVSGFQKDEDAAGDDTRRGERERYHP